MDDKSDMTSEPATNYSKLPEYPLEGNDLLNLLSKVRLEDIPLAVKYLVDKLAQSRQEKSEVSKSNKWDNYQLSAEVKAMAPSKRKSVYGDYDAELTALMEEKYK